MANVLSLALRVTADASRLKLDPVQRALVGLGDQADKLTGQFAKFTGNSEAAAKAQERFGKEAQDLINTLRDGGPNAAAQFAAGFERLTEAANKEAAAFERAGRIIEANITPLQRFEREQEELNEQVRAGRITQETYERALAKAKTQLDGTSASADKTDKSIESLTRNVRILSTIEIGRVIVNGLQAIGNVISGVVSQVGTFVSRISQSFDQFNDLSARVGISVEALQGYSLAAKLAGVDTEAFGAAVQRLAVTIGKATPGDNLDKSLRAINLSVAELRGLAPEQQFSVIGAAISELPTAADRAAAAVAVFGKQGAALAPLFREGAASIEELRARADRLGIIVDQTQLNSIGAMNDAFDLARASVDGIAGQVLGNLAPAVTAVVDQFLLFIETFEGVEGTGGEGIANTISTKLLDVADYFAGKFDEFAGYLSGFSVSLESAGSVFATVANILTAISEGFRTLFNLIQVGVSALTAGLGKVLEGIGSWVDSDLQEFGRNLAASATAEADKNIAEMEDAATRAAAAFNAALDGGSGSTQSAGEGAASKFMDGVRSQFERERSPQFKIESNIDTTAERLSSFLASAGGDADEFFVKSAETLKVFEQQAEAGELTAAQIKIMTGFADQLNQKLDVELGRRQELAEAAEQQAQSDAKRLAELTKTSDAASKVAEDLVVVEREIARIREAASAEGLDAGAVQAAEAQIAQLERLRDTLDGQLEASSLGFANGFDEAFASTSDSFASLSEQALEFGQAGFDAAARLQEGIAAAQEQARDGILNREAYQQEIDRQQELFNKQLEDIRTLAAERQSVNEFVDEQLALQQFGGDSARLEASRQVAVIEAEIARVQQEIQRARDSGNQEALAAGIARVGQLDQVAAKERDIASGRAQFEEEVAKQRDAALKAQEAAAQKQQEAQKKAFEEQARAAAAEADRQDRRIRALNSIGQQSVSAGDLRSTEGASQFIQAAAGALDPAAVALAEARAQTKLLARIATNSGALQFLERGVGSTFTFLGGGA